MPPRITDFRQLLDDARITGEAARERVARAGDVAYWQSIGSGAAISARPVPIAAAPPSEATATAVAHLQRDGYCHLRGALDPALIQAANAAIDAVVAAKWPPLFAFVFDALWLIARSPAVVDFATSALGGPYSLIPHVWVHVVRPARDSAGFTAHVESLDAAGRLTMWLALTDATLETGCIYVLPRWAAPPQVVERFDSGDRFTRSEFIDALHAVRPLPARVGDLLSWGFDIVHWGGYATARVTERRSVSFELIAASATPAPHEVPLLPLDRLPSFEERLRTIGWCIHEYADHDPLMSRFLEIADALQRVSPR